MNAKLQVYVAKPVYSDQLKTKQNKKHHDFGPGARLAVYTAPRNETVIWRQEWMGARAGHEKARKTHEERANGGPSQAGGLGRQGGRRELHPSSERARQPGPILPARPRSAARTPGRVCDCCSAAFLNRAPPTHRSPAPGRESRAGVDLSLSGQFRVELHRLHPGRPRVPAR